MMTDYSQKEKAVVAALFKMKTQQTVKRIEEDHL